MAMLHKQRITVLLFMGTLIFLCMYVSGSSGMMGVSYMYSVDILNMSTNTFEGSLVVDKISLSFSALVCMIAACVFMFARQYMCMDPFYWRFTWLLLSFVISMNVLVFAGSLFMLLLGWDGLGISSFALIIYYQSNESLGSGFLTLLVNRIGDVLIMCSMFFFVLYGSSMYVYSVGPTVKYMMLLIGIAALTKSAQYPFSAWLPAAMAAPTPVSALVHSSTLVTAGVYILIRMFTTLSPSATLCSILLFCGSITSLLGGICAVFENDLKKVIAYSTLSQLGVMVFSLGLGSYTLALLHLYTHAMFKAMLFLVAGCVLIMAYGTQDIRLLGAVTKNNPMLLIFLNTSTFCLMGLPFLSSYYSKHSILYMMFSSNINLCGLIIMLVAVMLTSVYMVRLVKNLNWGPASQSIISSTLPLRMYLPMLPLYGGALVLGRFFSFMDVYSYTSVFLIPMSMDILLYFLLLLGVFLGLFVVKGGSYIYIVSMFYMDPVWKKSNYMSNVVLKHTKNFEVGWVEPYTYFMLAWDHLRGFMYSTLWGKNTLSFGAYAIMFTILYWFWYSLS